VGRNLRKGRKLVIDVITVGIIYFDVECPENFAPGTECK